MRRDRSSDSRLLMHGTCLWRRISSSSETASEREGRKESAAEIGWLLSHAE